MLNKQTKIAVTTNKKGTKKNPKTRKRIMTEATITFMFNLRKKENTIQDGNRQIHVLHTIM